MMFSKKAESDGFGAGDIFFYIVSIILVSGAMMFFLIYTNADFRESIIIPEGIVRATIIDRVIASPDCLAFGSTAIIRPFVIDLEKFTPSKLQTCVPQTIRKHALRLTLRTKESTTSINTPTWQEAAPIDVRERPRLVPVINQGNISQGVLTIEVQYAK